MTAFVRTFLAVVAVMLPATTLADTLGRLHKSFMERYDEANSKRDDQLKQLDGSYLAALQRQQDKAKTAGKLDAVLPWVGEIQAIKTGTSPLPDLAESAPNELKQMRAKHAESRDKITKSHAIAITGLADKMEQALKAQETELTKAGKIDEALAAKHMRETLAGDQAITSARDLLAAASARQNAGEWRSLLKEPMEVLKKGNYDPCVLSEIRPTTKILNAFTTHLEGLRDKPENILMSIPPAVLDFKLSQHATQIRGKLVLAHQSGSVHFKIHASEKLIFDQIITNEAITQPFDIKFEPTRLLRLEADPMGSETHDWAAWLNPEIR